MKGDFTRSTHEPKKHYSGVRQQQGRVQLDADWNEQVDIDTYLRETSLGDLIGSGGAPLTGGGFKVGLSGDASDLTLSAGRIYVDGILGELESPGTTYTGQFASQDPALAALKPALPAKTGTWFVFLDVWQRHITALEDPRIRETALGGPDTATRTQTFWQVRLLEVDASSHCLSAPDSWKRAIAQPSGKLRARTRPPAPPKDPCVVPASAGYTRLENQLYRVEVHTGGDETTATFKWSRENGSVVAEWSGQDAGDLKRLQIRRNVRDQVLGFAPGQWVELTDDTRDVQGTPGVLVKLVDVQGDVLLIDTAGQNRANFPVHPKIRRWEQVEPNGADKAVKVKVPADDNDWIPLEGDIQVAFEKGTYRTGDYWLIPARAFIGEFSGAIEWPEEAGKPAALQPHGVEHHFYKLAVVDFDNATKKFSNVRDCRLQFPAATELLRIFHVGGDGQEALPGQQLVCPLEVGVTNGQWPVPGALVEFKLSPDSGSLTIPGEIAGKPGTTATGADGVARCLWTMPQSYKGGAPFCLVVTATLRDVAGNAISVPVVFHARLSIASQVHYNSGNCTHLSKANTVKEALDILCANVYLSYVGGDGQAGGPKEVLPQPLEVRAANGRSPQPGAQVRFKVIEGKGMLSKDRTGAGAAPELILPTDANGLAACFWVLGEDVDDPRQRVEAALVDVPTLPIHFNASFLDREKEPGVHIKDILSLAEGKPIENDLLTPVSRLASGFRAMCDQDIVDFLKVDSQFPVPAKPNVMVLLYLPYPMGGDTQMWDFGGVFGFQPLLLAGRASVEKKNEIHWRPDDRTREWLTNVLFQRVSFGHFNGVPSRSLVDRLLVRIILKGNFLWSNKDGQRLFVDGDVFGLPPRAGGGERIDLQLPSGDGRKGGDFEMWFWVAPELPAPNFDFNFNVAGNVISGLLRAGGQALPGITMTLSSQNRPTVTAVTNADGAFRFANVQAGRYTLQATVAGAAPLSKEVTVGTIGPVGPGGPLGPIGPIGPIGPLGPGLAADEEAAELRLRDVPGVGRSTAAKLTESGIKSPAELAEAAPERLEELGLRRKTAEDVIAAARKLLGR